MENQIILNLEDNRITVRILGDWDSYILPTKNILNLNGKYYWSKLERLWVKDIRSLDNVKKEYNFLKDNFPNIDFTNFKEKLKVLLLEDKCKKLDIVSEAEKHTDDLPENIKKVAKSFQIEGYKRFRLQDNQILLGWQMGCLSSSTIVTINIRNSSKQITIKELYELFNCKKIRRKKSDIIPINYNKETYIRSYNKETGVFQLYKVSNVIYSGKKETIKLYFDNNKELICTKDHKILTENGWIEADRLNNDIILSNGEIVKCIECGSEYNIRYNKRTYRTICHKCWLKKFKKQRYSIRNDGYVYIDWKVIQYHPNCPKGPNGMLLHRLIYEASLNHLTFNEWLEKIINNNFNDKDIFLIKDTNIHHKDGNKKNNNIENLECLTSTQHKKLHAKIGKVQKHFTIMIPKKTKLLKKENNGIIDVYDITVPESECFVANNIIVHNCGKTFGSLAITEAAQKKAIIIPTKSLIKQWKKEILKWNLATDNEIFLYDDKNKFFTTNNKYYIFNYEKFRFLQKDPSKYTKKELQIFEWLNNINPDEYILILDEMYKIKNYGNQLYKGMEILRNKKWYGVIGLTGTPQENSLFEFYTILNYIKPYCITWQDMEKYFIYRPDNCTMLFRNLDYFNELASKVMYRVRKEDVIEELPKLTQTYRFVESSKEAYEAFDILREKAESTFEIYTTLRTLDSYFKPTEDLKYYVYLKNFVVEQNNKLEELLNILGDIKDQKLLIFTAYSTTMKWLVNKLKNKFKVEGIDASVKNKDEVAERFVNTDLQIVIATDTWAYGVNLPTIDYLVNWDLLPNPAKMAQRRDRIHRLDSLRPKTVITLVSDIVENDIYGIISSKLESIEQSVEGESKLNIEKILSEKWGITRKLRKSKKLKE
jgi:superfamily II DNA or RNA helicase